MPDASHAPARGTPWHFLLYLPVYIFNIALIIAFQCVFIHTVPGPVTAEKLLALPAFAGTEVLDISRLPTHEGVWPGTGTVFPVLYQTADGTQYVTHLDGNLVLNRFGVTQSTEQVAADGTVRVPMRFGSCIYHVQDGKITEVVVPGIEHRQTSLTLLTAGGLVLLAAEITVLRSVSRRRKSRQARDTNAA